MDINVLNKLNTTIDNAIASIMNNILPNIKFTTKQEGEILYVYVNDSNNREYFESSIKYIIFKNIPSTKINKLLNVNIDKIQLINSLNNYIYIIIIVIIILIVLLIILHLFHFKMGHLNI
jgi:hypothetical protein